VAGGRAVKVTDSNRRAALEELRAVFAVKQDVRTLSGTMPDQG
jgi:hypothetical protein